MKLIHCQDKEPKMHGGWHKLLGDPNIYQPFAEHFPIYLRCPQCGKLQSISSKVHKVEFHDDGTFSATPSFVCAFPPCPWHVYITRSEAKNT